MKKSNRNSSGRAPRNVGALPRKQLLIFPPINVQTCLPDRFQVDEGARYGDLRTGSEKSAHSCATISKTGPKGIFEGERSECSFVDSQDVEEENAVKRMSFLEFGPSLTSSLQPKLLRAVNCAPSSPCSRPRVTRPGVRARDGREPGESHPETHPRATLQPAANVHPARLAVLADSWRQCYESTFHHSALTTGFSSE